MNKEINPIELFREECITEVSQQGNDLELVETSKNGWINLQGTNIHTISHG